jgi:chromosome segregation ATPase
LRRILLFRRIAQCTLLYLAYRRPPGEHGFLTLDHTQAICDSPIPDHLSPEYSESDYLLELSCSKACSSATQLRTNYEKSRSQIESIQRSLLSKDDCMSEKIGRYEESILRLTLQVKELQDERESERSGLKHDEWAEKRIQILEEEVSFKNEQVNAHQAAIGKKMNDLSEQHTKEILKVEEKVRTRHTEIDALLEPAVLCSEIVLNLMLDIRTKMHHVDTNLFAKQQESLQIAQHQMQEEEGVIRLVLEQTEYLHCVLKETCDQLRNKCTDLESELLGSRTHAERLRAQCEHLSEQVTNANGRGLIMELHLNQVLEDTVKFAGLNEELTSTKQELGVSFDLIHKLCVAVEGYSSPSCRDLPPADPQIAGSEHLLQQRTLTACDRLQAMNAELSQVIQCSRFR